MSSSLKTDRPMVVGMIGVNNFGAHRRGIMRSTGLFKIAAAFDRNTASLGEVCKQEGGAKACQSVEEVLATPGLEGLVVSTGVDTHTEFSVRGMQAGLHIYVEKPLCSRVEEVVQLRDAAKQTRRVVAVGHSDNASNPVNQLVKEYMSNGALGTVACYEENSSHSGGLEIKPGDWRGIRNRNPGGMLLQCGVHSLHGLNYLFGPVREVSAMLRYDANHNTETADVGNVLIRHESGMVGTLNCYHVTAYIHELRVMGSAGNLYIDTHAKKAWYQARKRGEVEPRVEVAVPAAAPGYNAAGMVSWFEAVRGQGACTPSLEEGISALLPVLAAEIADTQRRTVALNEVTARSMAHV